MLLKNLIEVLGEEFGLAEVTKEAVGQYEVEKVRLLARSLSRGRQKIPRIKAVRLLFGWGLKEAKEWVEAKFDDDGNGDSI